MDCPHKSVSKDKGSYYWICDQGICFYTDKEKRELFN